MPDKSILDLSRLEEAFEDDVVGIAELLDMALETGAKHTRALREAISAHHIENVARAAHGIKGSAANIGAPIVTNIATALEDRARKGEWDGVAPLVDELDDAYAQLRSAVHAYHAEIA